MLRFRQLTLLDKTGEGSRHKLFLPPEELVHVALLRRADGLEVELK
jgi:hypothetical protein